MLRDRLHLHVLALDWSEVQTKGAARKEDMKANRRSGHKHAAKSSVPHNQNTAAPPGVSTRNGPLGNSSAGSLTYVTTKIDTDTLLASARAWLAERHPSVTPDLVVPTPVLLVALHACGSLTPDILRAFVAAYKPAPGTGPCVWAPRAAVIVGCCYNMLREQG